VCCTVAQGPFIGVPTTPSEAKTKKSIPKVVTVVDFGSSDIDEENSVLIPTITKEEA